MQININKFIPSSLISAANQATSAFSSCKKSISATLKPIFDAISNFFSNLKFTKTTAEKNYHTYNDNISPTSPTTVKTYEVTQPLMKQSTKTKTKNIKYKPVDPNILGFKTKHEHGAERQLNGIQKK